MENKYDYVVAIPSYKRARTVCEKTLNTLKLNKVKPCNIFVFVADEKESEEYQKELSGDDFTECVNIILGAPTLVGQRNFIRNFFEEGTRVLSLDDDIKRIRLLTRKGGDFLPEKWSREGVREYTSDGYDYIEGSYSFDEHVRHGFKLCEKYGSKIFGFAPNKSPLALSLKIHKDKLVYLEGSAWGFVVTNNTNLELTVDEDKEDFERSVLYWEEFGQIIRLLYIGIDTAFWTEKGGMQDTRTQERAEGMAKHMGEKYPHLCSVFTKTRPVSGENHWTSKEHLDVKLLPETREQWTKRRHKEDTEETLNRR